MTQPVLKTKVTELENNSRMDDKQRQFFSTALTNAVADTYRLLINTQTLHWNVQGPLFYSVHMITESQYEDLFKAIDVLAERARILGFPVQDVLKRVAPKSDSDFLNVNAQLKDQIASLAKSNEQIANQFRAIAERASQIGDVRTADLLSERVGIHEENAWMLKATASA